MHTGKNPFLLGQPQSSTGLGSYKGAATDMSMDRKYN